MSDLPLQALESLGELGEVAGFVPITVPIKSSAIRTATYTASEQRLVLVMTDGSTLEHDGVSPATFTGLITAASADAYFNRYIRGRA